MEFEELTLSDLENDLVTRVDNFTNEDALALGLAALDVINTSGRSLAVDVRMGADLVFRAKTGTTGTPNNEWLEGKAATARHFEEPSLLVRRRLETAGTYETSLVVNGDEMRVVGGAIPIFVKSRFAGTVAFSGQPDYVDHQLCALAVARWAQRL